MDSGFSLPAILIRCHFSPLLDLAADPQTLGWRERRTPPSAEVHIPFPQQTHPTNPQHRSAQQDVPFHINIIICIATAQVAWTPLRRTHNSAHQAFIQLSGAQAMHLRCAGGRVPPLTPMAAERIGPEGRFLRKDAVREHRGMGAGVSLNQ